MSDTLSLMVKGVKESFGTEENDYITVVVGVLINPSKELAMAAEKELDSRIESDTLPCASGFITLSGYGRREGEGA